MYNFIFFLYFFTDTPKHTTTQQPADRADKKPVWREVLSGRFAKAQDACFGYKATLSFTNGYNSKTKNEFADISLFYGHKSI
ncbi:hypothetical protein A0U91_01435 [Acetobacter persici]|uniref:Uncharacterized protein n=1 Tax=Acetobacter persici TaxID=1076596 RepID=A0A1U9LBW9_9PROT|nr:hypothetical protein A0U91_01435 [Acetobacter persici]